MTYYVLSIIVLKIIRKENGPVKVICTLTPPLLILHNQVHNNLLGLRKGIPKGASQPNAEIQHAPDQFRVIATAKGGGENGTTLSPFNAPDSQRLTFTQEMA